jgi:solute:Na+ symporter, SSS family
VLKWHWWRFNGHGYFWGMTAGIAASMVLPLLFPHALPLYYFPLTLAVSVMGCIVGTYATPPTDERVLTDFYRTTRPWGFWKPIHDRVVAADPAFERNTHFRRDMFNVTVGVVWQLCLTIVPIYIVLKQGVPLMASVVILVITCVILKKNWYDRLERA